jgi:sugar lactone lactonase YvrE
VYGGAVTLFLGGRVSDAQRRVIATPGVSSVNGSVAVSGDGSTLLVADCLGGSHAIHEFSVADGSRRRIIGERGDGPLQFDGVGQVWIASDDYVFVADCNNRRVQVLTPRLDFHGFVGVGHLEGPDGVCANADFVAVSENSAGRISVFSRGDGALLRRLEGPGFPCSDALCLVSDRHIAVAEFTGARVCVYDVEGDFIGVVVDGVNHPCAVACFALGELAVVEHKYVTLFATDDALGHDETPRASGGASPGSDRSPIADCGPYRNVVEMGGFRGGFSGVATHGSTLFAHADSRCVLFTWH